MPYNRCRSVGVVWGVNVGIYSIHGVSGWYIFIGLAIGPAGFCSWPDPASKVIERLNPKMESAREEGNAKNIDKIEKEFKQGSCLGFHAAAMAQLLHGNGLVLAS